MACSWTTAIVGQQVTLYLVKKIFDNLLALQALKPVELHNELDRYLSTDPKHVTDMLAWWYEHQHVYPHLHLMALDYLSIPGMF